MYISEIGDLAWYCWIAGIHPAQEEQSHVITDSDCGQPPAAPLLHFFSPPGAAAGTGTGIIDYIAHSFRGKGHPLPVGDLCSDKRP
jgi:hypothetical protein